MTEIDLTLVTPDTLEAAWENATDHEIFIHSLSDTEVL